MNETAPIGAYGVLTEPATLTIQRLLPGPIERVWDYLTKSELRRQWLAAGDMAMKEGAEFELVWRNDELSATPGPRPEGFPEEQRMACHVVECDPPRRLTITWRDTGNVTFELEPRGGKALLTVIHRRLPDRPSLLAHAAGWHMHLDILAARASGAEPQPFWPGWQRLRGDYDGRFPA